MSCYENLSRTLFYRTPRSDCFWRISYQKGDSIYISKSLKKIVLGMKIYKCIPHWYIPIRHFLVQSQHWKHRATCNLRNTLTVNNKDNTTMLIMLIIYWHSHEPAWKRYKNNFPRTYYQYKNTYRSSQRRCSKGKPTQVFSCEFCEIIKNTFLTEHLPETAF